jgi:archaellum component FlaC
MSENNLTEQQAQLQQVESFYNAIVNNLKGQIADMAEQKAVQYAENLHVIQSLNNKIRELEQKIKELSEK